METDQSLLEAKAERVFEFDKRIRFVVLLTADGRLIRSVKRPEVVSLEPQSESETVYVKAGIAINMAAPMNRFFGPVRTVILMREKLTIICFNLTGRILLLSASPDFQLEKVEPLGQLVDELNIS